MYKLKIVEKVLTGMPNCFAMSDHQNKLKHNRKSYLKFLIHPTLFSDKNLKSGVVNVCPLIFSANIYNNFSCSVTHTFFNVIGIASLHSLK